MKYFLDTFGLDSEVAFESCLRENTEQLTFIALDLSLSKKIENRRERCLVIWYDDNITVLLEALYKQISKEKEAGKT